MSPGQVDLWLLDNVYQPIAWRLEYRYQSLNCFRIARILALMFALYYMVTNSIAALYLSKPHYSMILIVISCMSIAVWSAFGFRYIRDREREMMDNPDFLNPQRPLWFVRLGAGIIIGSAHHTFLVDLISFAAILSGITVFWIYSIYCFTACNPLPPGWSPPVRDEKLVAESV